MPAASITAWDLTPFMPYLHNWRKNIIFIECDRVAIETIVETLSKDYPKHEIYAGIKKPMLKIRINNKEAAVVIIAGEGKNKREIEGKYPKLEKCLVDLLFYAKNELLPISLTDILDLWRHYLTTKGLLHFNELYRYSQRRYLGWFVSIFAYELSKKTKSNADTRHCKTGLKNMELIKTVVQFE
ncbi:hypothetical protein AUJ17_01165 [Candidatus Micrarchaeota archaeon CG1_02_47_40]|nr:MAG: hypothetical protein AUJ17_01165 [Candidatus Micrarchaeota archaeon CG1_02_47_40]